MLGATLITGKRRGLDSSASGMDMLRDLDENCSWPSWVLPLSLACSNASGRSGHRGQTPLLGRKRAASQMVAQHMDEEVSLVPLVARALLRVPSLGSFNIHSCLMIARLQQYSTAVHCCVCCPNAQVKAEDFRRCGCGRFLAEWRFARAGGRQAFRKQFPRHGDKAHLRQPSHMPQ